MKIQNLTDLATTPPRTAALQIAEHGLVAIDTETVLESNVSLAGDTLSAFGKTFPLSSQGRLIIIAVGKCAGDAAGAFEKILGDRITTGIALGVGEYNPQDNQQEHRSSAVPPKLRPALNKIIYHAGTHPMPSEMNVAGTKAILDSLKGLTADDTVLFLISGGGSTLLCQPPLQRGEASLANNAVNAESDALLSLFRAGATIQEINTIRKHLSLARGGDLAADAFPAQVISLIFSDVPGNDIEFISSGPTVKDDTTVADALRIADKYKLIIGEKDLTETPKDAKLFERVTNILALSDETALEAMKKTAESLGFAVEIKDSKLTGEAREVGARIADEINKAPANTVFIYSGETTVTIHGHGNGGRNQEVALSALPLMGKDRVLLSVNSDGHDNGPYAGAIADEAIMTFALKLGLLTGDFLAKNDSNSFFLKAGGLIETGDTGSNISDLIVAVAGK